MTLALAVVFIFAAVFYLWTAGTSLRLSLHSPGTDRYNLLADALLHLHLSVARPPAGLLHVADPYNPALNAPFLHGKNDATTFVDDILYHGRLYLLWGPAPAVVWLIPMHLLGFEPSSSVTCAVFAIVGLAFALGTLRVLLRAMSESALGVCVLAGAGLALCSAVPFILRAPSVTEDTICGGYCFAMAGIWLASTALVAGRASLRRLALMSLCFGLAIGSRATLGLTALVLVPVLISLRSSRPLRGLILSLGAPIGGCLLLLIAYNLGRFGQPLQFGGSYQLAGYDPQVARFGELSYLPPGAWAYLLSPPRPALLFPFIHLGVVSVSYPFGLSANYDSEIAGGLLPMTPIVFFLLGLPWIWRRRAALLGSLAPLILVLAGVGMTTLLYIAYEWLGSTERYEVDFSTVLLFGALSGWLGVSHLARGRLRRAVRIGGGVLIAWGCLTGFAISLTSYGNALALKHPGTWTTLANLGSPLSSLLADATGHPVIAEVVTRHPLPSEDLSYISFSSPVKQFWLSAPDNAQVIVVSPSVQSATLVTSMIPGVELVQGGGIQGGGGGRGVSVLAPGHGRVTYQVPAGGEGLSIPLELKRGINRVSFSPLTSTFSLPRGLAHGLPLVVISISLPPANR